MTEMNYEGAPGATPALKTDIWGRVLVSAERREALLDEFEKSGLSGPSFSELAGIKYQTFATWMQKRKRERAQYPTPARGPGEQEPTNGGLLGEKRMQWMEAVLEPAIEAPACGPFLPDKAPEALCVHLPGGARLEIADSSQAALAAELLKSLEKLGRCNERC